MEAFRSTLGSLTWNPTLSIAKTSILSTLSRIKIGSLILIDETNQTRHVFGQKRIGRPERVVAESQPQRRIDAVPQVELTVKRDEFWMRLFLFADMGFAEAFMLKDVECYDLTSFFQVYITKNSQTYNP